MRVYDIVETLYRYFNEQSDACNRLIPTNVDEKL